MLNKFINYTGLQTVIDWIKKTFVQKETGKGLSTEDYTTTDKQKVTAIPDNPKYTDTIQDLTPYLEKTEASTTYATKLELEGVDVTAQLIGYQKTEAKGIAGGYASLGQDGKVPVSQLPDDKDTITTINGKTGAISKADIVALGIPAQDTNTTYTSATTTSEGLMQPSHVTKLNTIAENAEVNTITQIKRNGTILNPVNKSIDISVPVAVSELTNDNGFLTNAQVQQLISDARYMKKTIVETLPTTGEENTLYLKGVDGAGVNLYEEYMFINDKWELIGSTETEVDLSGYVKSSDIQIATTEEIELLLVN